MQLLNLFFLRKDLMNRFFNENRKSLHKVMNQYILHLWQQLLALFLNFYFIFLGFILFPGTPTILGTWWLSLLILPYRYNLHTQKKHLLIVSNVINNIYSWFEGTLMQVV